MARRSKFRNITDEVAFKGRDRSARQRLLDVGSRNAQFIPRDLIIRLQQHGSVQPLPVERKHPDSEDGRRHHPTPEALDRIIAAMDAQAERRKRRQRAPRRPLTADDPRHGTTGGYTNHACRCEQCKKAAADYHRLRNRREVA